MFPGRYSEIFGRGERLGCILNLGHSFHAIEADFGFASVSIYASSELFPFALLRRALASFLPANDFQGGICVGEPVLGI